MGAPPLSRIVRQGGDFDFLPEPSSPGNRTLPYCTVTFTVFFDRP